MKTNKIFTVLAAAAAVVACNKNADLPSSEHTRGVTFSSIIADGNLTRTTSELQTTAISSSVSVGVFGTQGDASVAANVEHSVNSEGNLSSTTEISCTDGAASFYAYAPYAGNWEYSSNNEFAVAVDQTSEANYLASDLLYGVPTSTNPVTISSTNTSVPLTFSHKLARLVITVKKATGVTKELANSTVSINGTKIGTTLNPSTGALGTATGTATPIKVASLASEIAAGEEESATIYAIIVPQEVSNAVDFIKITKADNNKGDNNNYTLAARLSETTTFESGKTYSLTVIVGGGVTPSNIAVSVANAATALNTWTPTEALTNQNSTDPTGSQLVATLTTGAANNWKYYAEETSDDEVSYAANTFRWTASNNNLMPLFSFSNGELVNYSRLFITIGNLTDNKPRLGYYVGDSYTNLSSTFGSAGTKKYDLAGLGINLSTVTSIVIGGNGATGTCTITDIKLLP